jgi:hypothetical protein
MAVAVFQRMHPDRLLPGPVWGFEGDFATLSFVALPMINEVDVRDEKRENEGKGAKGKDSKGRTTSEGTARKYIKKKNTRSDRIGVWIQNKGPNKQGKK